MELAPFLECLQQRAGDALQAVQWYREDAAELIYLRDDLNVEDVQLEPTRSTDGLPAKNPWWTRHG